MKFYSNYLEVTCLFTKRVNRFYFYREPEIKALNNSTKFYKTNLLTSNYPYQNT